MRLVSVANSSNTGCNTSCNALQSVPMKTIRVSHIIGSVICVAPEDGEKLFDIICQSIDDDIQIEVSFEGIELVIAAFLNVAIGALYGKFPKEKIANFVSYTHLHNVDRALLKLVVANALRYFSKE